MSITGRVGVRVTDPLTLPLTQPGVGGGGGASTDAWVIVLLGQSINATPEAAEVLTSWDGARMLTDACAISEFTYAATNVLHVPNWASVAGAVAFTEGAGQSPCVGVAEGLRNGPYPRAYLCSAAIGSQPLNTLNQGGALATLHGVTHRLCDSARADGFTPKVAFYCAHGERDATNGTTETEYYDRGMDYFGACQNLARLAMEDPAYLAPVLFTYPVQMKEGAADRVIREAIRRIAVDLDGGIDAGPIYQWPVTEDRTHPTAESYALRGEFIGRIVAGTPAPAVFIESVVLDGDEFTATFSEAVVRDASLGVGVDLNAANALDGFEWLDNGSYIQITSLTYNGATVTGTLASTPAGTIEQQVLRIGVQDVTEDPTADPADLPGSLVRAAGAGWASALEPSYTNFRWAIPQTCAVEAT